MRFKFTKLTVPDVIHVEPARLGDARGFFAEIYRLSEFEMHGVPARFVQDNLSRSAGGVLRGLHFQAPPKAQAKLVTCLAGEIWDVAVDLRRGSPTFGHHAAARLSGASSSLLYIPPGFAHGFCVLEGPADVFYKCSEEYDPALDRGVIWSDPELGIPWPVADPAVSPRDAALPRLRDISPA